MGSSAQEQAGSVRGMPRALRLRLVFWYGFLMALALILFSVIIMALTSNTLKSSVYQNTKSVAYAAAADIRSQVSPDSISLPPSPILDNVDIYREPMVIAILNRDGVPTYPLAGDSTAALPSQSAASAAAFRQVLDGQEYWGDTTIHSDHVYMGMVPICVPLSREQMEAQGESLPIVASCHGPVVGVVLVVKSFSDVDATLLTLQTLLIIFSVVVLLGALGGGWLIATHVLRPLEGVVATARAVTAATAQGTRIGNLSLRVPRPRGRDEIGLVIDSFNAMLGDLESAMRTQRRFVADASHELRAPLTTIQGNLAFLQRHVNELPLDESRTMLADAHGETLRLARLVDDLLLLARADASAIAAEERAHSGDAARKDTRVLTPLVEVDHAVLQLVRQLRRRLSAEGSHLKLEIGHIEPLRMRGDEEMLRRVVLILLDNALKYTSSDHAEQPGRVTVSLERVDGEAVLRVSDTGIGIDPADLPHIFERFYRADRARSREGTGLGLSIAQTLVEQLGGRITAESVPGEGSTFSVWLPLAGAS